jgi:hypothetical protein
MKELTYLNADGHTVFTSQFLKNRGTCCKTACLHCPYGFTLKKLGLKFREGSEADAELISQIMAESGTAPVDWRGFLPSNLQFLLLKDEVCGFMLKNHIVVKHVFLRPQFQQQGLSKEMIESYYFI